MHACEISPHILIGKKPMLKNCPHTMRKYELCRMYNFLLFPQTSSPDSNWFKSYHHVMKFAISLLKCYCARAKEMEYTLE